MKRVLVFQFLEEKYGDACSLRYPIHVLWSRPEQTRTWFSAMRPLWIFPGTCIFAVILLPRYNRKKETKPSPYFSFPETSRHSSVPQAVTMLAKPNRIKVTGHQWKPELHNFVHVNVSDEYERPAKELYSVQLVLSFLIIRRSICCRLEQWKLLRFTKTSTERMRLQLMLKKNQCVNLVLPGLWEERKTTEAWAMEAGKWIRQRMTSHMDGNVFDGSGGFLSAGSHYNFNTVCSIM